MAAKPQLTLFERVRDIAVHADQRRPDVLHRCNRGDGDERRDQRIFDRGRPFLSPLSLSNTAMEPGFLLPPNSQEGWAVKVNKHLHAGYRRKPLRTLGALLMTCAIWSEMDLLQTLFVIASGP